MGLSGLISLFRGRICVAGGHYHVFTVKSVPSICLLVGHRLDNIVCDSRSTNATRPCEGGCFRVVLNIHLWLKLNEILDDVTNFPLSKQVQNRFKPIRYIESQPCWFVFERRREEAALLAANKVKCKRSAK